MPKNLVIMLSAGALALGVAACGGSSSSSSSAAPATSSSAAAPATSSTTAAPATSSSSAAAAAPSSGGASTIAIAANPGGALKFDKTSLTAKAGKVTIAFTNKAPEGHNFTIETSGGAKVAATPTFDGGTKTITATLKKGTYTFLCTVPGHAMGGMKGTLTVS
jgi:plastocyanin